MLPARLTMVVDGWLLLPSENALPAIIVSAKATAMPTKVLRNLDTKFLLF